MGFDNRESVADGSAEIERQDRRRALWAWTPAGGLNVVPVHVLEHLGFTVMQL